MELTRCEIFDRVEFRSKIKQHRILVENVLHRSRDKEMSLRKRKKKKEKEMKKSSEKKKRKRKKGETGGTN